MNIQHTPNQPPPEILHRLINPYRTATSVVRVQADMSTEDYNYLFRGVLAGSRGSQAQLINTILQKLINELRTLNLPSYYDPTNESIVAECVSRCTFRRVDRDTPSRDVAGTDKGVHVSRKNPKGKSTDAKGKASGGKRQDRKETTSQEDQG